MNEMPKSSTSVWWKRLLGRGNDASRVEIQIEVWRNPEPHYPYRDNAWTARFENDEGWMGLPHRIWCADSDSKREAVAKVRQNVRAAIKAYADAATQHVEKVTL